MYYLSVYIESNERERKLGFLWRDEVFLYAYTVYGKSKTQIKFDQI